MTQRPARFTQPEIRRAIRAAKKEGMAVDILPDGTIRISHRADSEISPDGAKKRAPRPVA